MTRFANRLSQLRSEREITQQVLADAIGVTKSLISMSERGKRMPSYEVQEALADFFNVDVDYLIGRSDRTTVVMTAENSNPQRRFLMDKIAKADDRKLNRIRKLMEIIDEEIDNS